MSEVDDKIAQVRDRAWRGKSIKAIVRAKCFDCACASEHEVRLCPVRTCPLWPYRLVEPMRRGKERARRMARGEE